MSGNSGLSVSATQTDSDDYRSTRVAYMDPWVYVRDDVDGTQRLIPPQSFGASVAAQLPPSTSIAWKSGEVGAMLNGIVALQADRGAAKASNTSAGIVTVIKQPSGGYRFEADPVTNAPVNPAKKSLRRTRVGDFIAVSFLDSVQDQVDAPNVPVVQQGIMNALARLLADLKQAQDRDPAHNAFIKDYSPPVVASTATEIAQGELEIDVNVQVGSAAEQIFLGINFGETVEISAS
jgi:phage tail sheath protein FI